MRILSIDIETTGLNRETCQILEIGIIVEDCANPLPFDETPQLRLVMDLYSVFGEPYAINMNARIFRLLAAAQDIRDKAKRQKFKNDNNIVSENTAVRMMWEFMYLHGFGTNYVIPINFEPGATHMNVDYATAMKHYGGNKNLIILPSGKQREQLKVNVAGKNFGTFDKVFLEKMPGFTDLIRFRQRIIDPSTSYADFVNDDELPNMDKCYSKLGVYKSVAHDAVLDAWDVICLLRPLYSTYDVRIGAMSRTEAISPHVVSPASALRENDQA